MNLLCLDLSGPPEISHPPYLSNGDRLREFYCTIGFKTLKNWVVGQLKTPKKNPNFGGDTHVTLNPGHKAKPKQPYRLHCPNFEIL